ncbi:MAG: DNA gyrase subunit A [Rhodospirillaceae bacterium]|nr:DNA gyrase subunit A [Rhodospirillaceae bacterium]
MTSETLPPEFDITPIAIEDEMKSSYLDYAMSVIVSRALPDVRDGLKPVHRRILYAMKEEGYDWNRAYRKSARVVGDVMGKYHPHGDTAIYDAMVRMAQAFSMRLMLIDGQGNFGSMDGDRAAAMRYTEVRLHRSSEELLEDIDRDTVDFQANYDETVQEPTVLPARFPNLLVNGAGGIAVGMATNIPTHNLGEVIDGCCALLDNPDISINELIEIIPGPDFPTGGLIMGRNGINQAYHTGRGSVVIRGRTHVEEIRKDREAIIVTEIPYQVNKARMIERIAEMVRDKRIEGISDIRDESDRDGVRVVIEVKRDHMAEVVLNQLFRYTPLQTSFGINMLALNGGRPQQMTVRDVLVAFIAFREEVITRRTIYELGKARDRAHVLVGLAIAVANIDKVIELIRSAPDPVTAREGLMKDPWPAGDVASLIELIDEPGRGVVDGKYQLSETQARAILDLRLQRLTGLERGKIAEELEELAAQITEYLDVLASREKVRAMLKEELLEVREKFADDRRTTIDDSEFEADIEDLIQREDMVVTVTHGGYIKRVPVSTYRAQRRGGKGRAGMSTRDEDFVSNVYVVNTHTPVLFFSSRGMVYKLKVYKVPLGTPQARGKALVNLLPLDEGETITTLMPLPEDESACEELDVMFATASGSVRRNRLSDFVNVMANGKIAMKLAEGDHLVDVSVCDEGQDVLLSTAKGKCIRFPTTDVRLFAGRSSSGVRGIRLAPGDNVMSMSTLNHASFSIEERDAYLRRSRAQRMENDEAAEANGNGNGENSEAISLSDERYAEMAAMDQFILTLAANGYGKRTSSYEYTVRKRGGQGIANINLDSGKDNSVVASFPVVTGDQLVLVTDNGQMIRTGIDEIRIAGRATRGVIVFRVAEDEHVVSVSRLSEEEDDEEESGDTDADQGTEVSEEAGGEAEEENLEQSDTQGQESEQDDD